MRLRLLALYPLVYAALYLAVAGALDGGAVDRFIVGQRIVLRVLAIVGCFAAASAFEAADRLRRAWIWMGVGTVVILVRDVVRLFPPFSGTPVGGPEAFLNGLGILSNIALLVAIWMLARAWRLVTLDVPGGRTGMVLIVLITAAVALAVAGPGALQATKAVLDGHWDYLVIMVSALVDIVSLCLITPLLLTAVALRGGLFFWPWALITASRLVWILYDAAAVVAPSNSLLPDLFRGLAQNYVCVAGLAQLLVVQHVRSRTRAGRAGS
ncbi:MAG TPA: hypothetical protein VH394_06330 [Thermoanaerobaculia bacterium]|jgi:hypothetical protein|nr:hypothetical protein [Thermoanaerobaculia bacterium]